MVHPRETTELFGHDAAEATLHTAWRSGRMPHAWILSGERGIGKATLCYRFARTLLGEGAARRIAIGSHADLLVVEPAFDTKKDEAKREITADQAREILTFLSLTAGEGGVRIAIVDSADELNANAANAILKIVEEPPAGALLFLVSHNPGSLLPTLRSRCRSLKMPPPSEEDFRQALLNIDPTAQPHIPILTRLSHHSPGLALEMLGLDGVGLYSALLKLMAQLPAIPPTDILSLSERIGPDKPHARWQAMTRLVLYVLALAAEDAAPHAGEEAALTAMARHDTPKGWALRYAYASDQFSLAARLHLDYKTTLVSFFHTLTQPAPLWTRATSI